MEPTCTAHVKRSIELLYCLLDQADESVWLALEGDLSQFDGRSLTGVKRTIRGNTGHFLSQPNNRVAIPLNPANVLALKMNVLPRVGIRAQIRHVFLERDGRCLFAAYDRFNNGATFSNWLTADFLAHLQRNGVIELSHNQSQQPRNGQVKNERIYNLSQQNSSYSHRKY